MNGLGRQLDPSSDPCRIPSSDGGRLGKASPGTCSGQGATLASAETSLPNKASLSRGSAPATNAPDVICRRKQAGPERTGWSWLCQAVACGLRFACLNCYGAGDPGGETGLNQAHGCREDAQGRVLRLEGGGVMGEGPEPTAQGSAGCATLGKSLGHSGLMSRPSDVNHACSPPQPLCAWLR